MRVSRLASLFASTSLALTCGHLLQAPLAAQDGAAPTAATGADKVTLVEGHGLPGKLPGTEQFLVHFEKRSFDLTKLREAVREGASAARVEAMIDELRAATARDQAAFVAAVEELGGRAYVQYWLINCCAIEVPFAQLGKVRAMANVSRVEPNLPVYPLIREATGNGNHNSDRVNTQGFTGKGIATAIVDTGLDERCGNKNRPHRTFYEDGDINKRNRLLANKQVGTFAPDNSHQHGTGVAGIAAGGTWGSSGADNGHAPGADIVGYSLSNSAGGGSDVATMARSWQMLAADAVAFKIKTANNSYSGGLNSNPLDAIQKSLDACAHTMDVCIVVAAGNNGASTRVSQPAVNGISVGALTATQHTVATFSSRGPHAGVPGMFFPNISACGVNTIMPDNDNETADYRASGTSMAAPQVCGAATLIRAAIPAMKAEQAKAILLATALDISSKNRSAPYNTRNAYGMGMLRDDMAMDLARKGNQHGMAKVTTAAPTWQRVFPVQAGMTYRMSAAWMRQTADTAPTAWSNLDIEVRIGSTVIGSSKTPLNTAETAVFTPTTAGAAVVRVTGVLIEKGEQDFGWAFTEATPAPFESKFATFGAGCQSASQACQVVASENWTNALAGTTTTSKEVGILEFNRDIKNICGLDFYMRSRSGSVAVTVGIRAYDIVSGKPGKVLVSRQVTVDGTARMHSVRWPEIAVTPRDLFIPFFDNADKIVLPVTQSGTTHVSYDYNGTVWSDAIFMWNFRYRIHSKPGLKTPVLSSSEKPVVGQTFKIDLESGPANRAALLAVGFSNSTWNSLPLPLVYAAPCSLLTSIDLIFPLATSGTGTGTVSLPIPNDPALVKLRFYQQFVIVDSANTIGLIVSNGGSAVLGDF